MKKWLVRIFTGLGIIALALLVWFVGPYAGWSGVYPLEGFWTRVSIIIVIFAITFGILGWKFYKKRKAAKEIEAALVESQGPDSDADILSDKMSDALKTLKKANVSKGDPLYDLPWYVIIGPPGSGKTTALINSGLKFPLAANAKPESVAGVGGTRYCDWWFTEDAVLIDTAGRYTTQDSDSAADKKSWLAFLDLLKNNRPKQPINGVIVTISLEDLMVLDRNEISDHADATRRRLMELHGQLNVDFPVYVQFTKADLVSGFMEFFGSFTKERRDVVWGATFQTDDKTRNMISEVGPEFDLLIARLNEEMVDRLQEEVDPLARVKLYGFATQMTSLKPAVVEFLNQVFEPTRYHTDAALRGFYFTSGTQEGTPIDRVLGAMSSSFKDANVSGTAYSGQGQSYFLRDMMQKVIFAEAGWVSSNIKAVRREFALRATAFSLLGLACVGMIAAWTVSYIGNEALITKTRLAVADYIGIAKPVLEEPSVTDTDFNKVLPLLDKLRYLPAGYSTRNDETKWTQGFGLSQRERLLSASKSSYRVALERVFRSRLILRLENQIQANLNDPVYMYEALKVYLMLGGRAPVRTDKNLILAWMQRDWEETLFPGPSNKSGRESLTQHLSAMLELDLGQKPAFELNGDLVAEARKTLARLSIAQRAYALIKSGAQSAPIEAWIASARGGQDAKLVFETKDGSDLDTVHVPSLFTYKGFHELFLGQLATIADKLDKEKWVLGEAGEQMAVADQYKRLGPDLLRIYDKDFIAAWKKALGNLKLRTLTADKPTYAALVAASAPTSPIKLLFVSVAQETQLTKERPQGGDGKLDKKEVARAKRRVISRYTSRLSGLSRIGIDLALKSQRRASGGQARRLPGANIEAYFKRFHQLAEGAENQKPIDKLVNNFNGVLQYLSQAANSPAQIASATQGLQAHISGLRTNASRLPEPLSGIVLSAIEEFEGDAAGSSIADLTTKLNNIVTRRCKQIITSRYPFSRRSRRDVPFADFSRLFSPNGIMDKFFNLHLAQFADLSKNSWVWKKDTRMGRELSLTTLRQFQLAAEIRDAFFPSGGGIPSVNVTATLFSMSRNATAAELNVNGSKLESVHGIDAPVSFVWPGASLGDGKASITLQPEIQDQKSQIVFKGAWAFFRMLHAGRIRKRGDGMSVRYVIGGRDISYNIKVGALKNPFLLPALRKFKCPSGL